ncbi:hypothetical protein EV127DRAFT_403700 [Xylaria flabelliformis]|nr:hypothetical protein EV127DRAFT_403700 [Xylaria flabelliformis]
MGVTLGALWFLLCYLPCHGQMHDAVQGTVVPLPEAGGPRSAIWYWVLVTNGGSRQWTVDSEQVVRYGAVPCPGSGQWPLLVPPLLGLQLVQVVDVTGRPMGLFMPEGGIAGGGRQHGSLLLLAHPRGMDLPSASRQEQATQPGSWLALLVAWSVAKFASLGRWVPLNNDSTAATDYISQEHLCSAEDAGQCDLGTQRRIFAAADNA